jgi:cytidine deaminase
MAADPDWQALAAAAAAARARAYAPYSGFAVGAALLMEDGSIVAGCNIENATFGLTQCAERVALAAAVARGLRQPAALAVASSSTPPAAPCGLCLQTLAEFSDDLPILLCNPDHPGGERRLRLLELLPYPFRLPGVTSAARGR